MLQELHIRNLAVLSEAAVELEPGLNVLTGETGAGKSIVVDSLSLLAGARASSELIRTDAEELVVTGVFAPVDGEVRRRLEEAGVEGPEDELVIRRQVSREGRNRVFVDDRPVTLGLLASVAPRLLRIHTQREELELVSPELQRRWLDRSGGEEAATLRRRVVAAWEAYRELARRLERLTGDESLRLERLDLLRFQAREIDAAGLEAGEEEELRRERDLLRHAEALQEALGGAAGLLVEGDGAAVDRLAQSRRLLDDVSEWEPRAVEWVEELEELRVRLEEVSREVSRRLERVEHDPRRLDRIEERLALLDRLRRKYGGESEEILARRREIQEELEALGGDESDREELEVRVAEALAGYETAALELSRGRCRWGEALGARVERELADLALPEARFLVELERRPREGSALKLDGTPVDFGPEGVDRVTFAFLANPGQEAGPLARIASGGELSRVFLALQLAVRDPETEGEPTLVFDEVDAGIGGAEAAALGRKLGRLAVGAQVLVVTHLAQVASHAARHFRVRKQAGGGSATVTVEPLEGRGQVDELARMMAGEEVTEISRRHARELIREAAGGA